MKPKEVQKSMKISSKLDVEGATTIIDQCSAESIIKIEEAYAEAEKTGGIIKRIGSLYRFFEQPPKSVMDEEEVRDGVASLCVALVILCRSKGIRILFEEM